MPVVNIANWNEVFAKRERELCGYASDFGREMRNEVAGMCGNRNHGIRTSLVSSHLHSPPRLIKSRWTVGHFVPFQLLPPGCHHRGHLPRIREFNPST